MNEARMKGKERKRKKEVCGFVLSLFFIPVPFTLHSLLSLIVMERE